MYRLPDKQKEIIKEQIKEMLQNDIIVPSKSPWNSPLLVVPKKDGLNGEKRWRVVVDFRKLNKVTVGDAFPLPRIEDILDQLGHARYFSTLDLASGYHQVLVDKNDREKTAFSTPDGHFEFKRMPFGLTGAPATFQRLMNYVLTGLDNAALASWVYLDDIVIVGKNLHDHNEKLTRVFERLRKNNLKLQPEKCQFLRKEVVYLGHKCSSEGALPDPKKSECVQNFPRPKTVRQVQSFLGLANYYRKFIPDFSKIAEPINKLLRKNSKFVWSEKCEESFSKLKQALVNPPILSYPDFSAPFILTTDASTEALGAVLSQGKIGEDKPIAYASRSLNKAERNYSVIEKELLAIVWAVKNFRCYLLGRKFTVYTDHKPLKGIFNVKDPGSRLLRFHYKLSEYDYNIEYKPGKYNTNADALSRIPASEDKDNNGDQKSTKKDSEKDSYQETTQCMVITRAQAQQQQEQAKDSDSESTQEDEISAFSHNGEIEKEDEVEKLEKPEDIQEVLKKYHDSPFGGHMGTYKTIQRIRKFYVWKGMQKDIKNYIKNCTKCQTNKKGKNIKMPMVITQTSQKPFEKIAMDIVGPLPETPNGNKYILTFQDDLTKIFDCIAIQNCEAETVADKLYKHIILRYFMIPKKILTDQGSNFVSEMFKKLCKLLRIKKLQTTPYHPQTNGGLERAHAPLIEYLRSIVDENTSSWDEWLGEAALAYNHTPHTTTKFAPVEALYGFINPIPLKLTKSPEPVYNWDDFCLRTKYKMQKIHEKVKENLTKGKQKSKEYYDQNTASKQLHVGDKVLIRNMTKKHKLSPVWKGPYEIIKVDNDVNCTIKIGKKLKRVHNNRIKLF